MAGDAEVLSENLFRGYEFHSRCITQHLDRLNLVARLKCTMTLGGN